MFTVPRIRTLANSARLPRLKAPVFLRAAGIHTTRVAKVEKKEQELHTTDSYAKEVDESPAADAKVHRVDPDSDRVQKPYEPPSGYSRSGVLHEEYRHTQKTENPYAPEGGEDSSYGAKNNWTREHGGETSGKEEGPDANSSGGRK